ncbi:MAG: BON domain-containing protein [Dehalococcoidia bacterium]
MADRYAEDYESGNDERQYRDRPRASSPYNGGEQYPGGYEGARSGAWDDQRFRSERSSAPAGRYGQGQSSSRYGQQGWEREQQPDQWTRPGEWSRPPQEADWQRRQQYVAERQSSRGGPYGMEYPESGYQGPGGYGEMYRGEMGQYSGQSRESSYGQYSGRGPKGYQRSDDRIREDVCERLTQAWDVDAEDIDVRVSNGEVTLSGSVMDRYQKRMAEDAIERVPGIRDVNNQLRAGMGGQARQGQPAAATSQVRPGQSSSARPTTSRAGSSGKSTSGARSTAKPKSSTSSRTTGARSPSSSARSSTAARSTPAARPRPPASTSRSSAPQSTSRSSAPASTSNREPSPDPFQPESRSTF